MPVRNLVLITLTLVVLAVWFVLLRPDPVAPVADAPQPASTPIDTDVATPSSGAASSGTQATATQAPDTSTAADDGPPLTAQIRIADGRRVQGPATVRVSQGDTVRIAFSSVEPAEIHLHGYDLTLHLAAGETRMLRFDATHSGRFAYELHGHHHGGHSALGVIEVLPR